MTKTITRRDFLKGSAAGAMSLAFAGFLGGAQLVEASEGTSQYDEINLANERDPTDLGPWAGNMGGASALIPLVYQSLFIMEYGQDEEPCLAKSKTQVDEDGYVWDVELFDYIYDSEGNQLTASDVRYSWEQAVSIGKVSSVKVVSDIEVTGDFTFTLTFSDEARMGDFGGLWDQFFIVTQAAMEGSSDSMSTQPIGTGAYIMTEYTSGSVISFEARDDFWQTDEAYLARSSAANVKKVNYWIITEAAQRANGIQEGTIDYGGVSSTDMPTIEALDNYYITEVPDNLTWMLFANVDESAVTSDILVRQAIFYAIDNEGVATSFTNSNGMAVPVYDISNSNYPDYYEEEYMAEAETNYYGYDPDKAMELLAEAGYSGGLTVRLTCSSEQAATDTATILEAYLSVVGINLVVSSYQSSLMSEYTDDATTWDLYLLQYASTDYAVNVWEKVLNKAKYSWGGTINFVMSDELQDMLSEVRTEAGHTKENVIAFHDYIIENAYALGLMQGINYYGTSTDITEVVFSDQYIIRPNACTYAV